MDNDVLINFINACNEDLINDKPVLYEAYFLKIYVAFENYLGELFEKYCIGQMSSEGYIPKRRLEFDTLEQLRNIINSGKKQNYIDYIDKIKSISKACKNQKLGHCGRTQRTRRKVIRQI